MRLVEAILSDHYLERKTQRGIIDSIEVQDKGAYGEYNKEETNTKLLPLLQAELDKRFIEVERNEYGQSKNYNLGYRFFMPVLVGAGIKSPIKMMTSKGSGHYHFVTVVSGKITTLMLSSKNKEGLLEQINDHIKRVYPDNSKEGLVMSPQDFVYEIDIDALYGVEKERPEGVKVSTDDLDYKIRTDYRVGATFEHDKYGKGKIVATSSGTKGVGDSSGIVDWIDVDFGKPYLKGGKLHTARRIDRVITKVSPMIKEEKGTCCHKCGHVHVKGTKCPTPYLRGERSCARRQNELHTMDHHASDEHHQVRADVEEMSLENPSAKTFLNYLEKDSKNLQDFITHFNFSTNADLDDIKDYLSGLDYGDQEWRIFQDWLLSKHGTIIDEVNEYCTACLAEYLLEYENKIEEAEYRGRKVSLGKPFLTPGGPKKRAVYVKNAKGNVVKVNFGDPNLKIKKNIPARRKAFRARHKCNTAKDRTSPRYWSCKAW